MPVSNSRRVIILPFYTSAGLELRPLSAFALLLFWLSGCSPNNEISAAVAQSPMPHGLILKSPTKDIGRQFLPQVATVEFVISNESAESRELRKIESSCACQGFSIDGRELKSTIEFNHTIAPGASCSLQVAIHLKPGAHEARFRVWGDTGKVPLDGQVAWEGIPPAKLNPPEHNVGLRNSGETVGWESQVQSTDGAPFTLSAAAGCPPIILVPGKDRATWTVSGVVRASGEGEFSVAFPMQTDDVRFPSVTVRFFGQTPIRARIPKIATVILGPGGARGQVAASILDPALSIDGFSWSPDLPNLSVTHEDGFLVFGGTAPEGTRSAVLTVRFSGDYPNRSVNTFFIHQGVGNK